MSYSKNDLAKKINDDGFISQVAKKYFVHYDSNNNRFLEKKELLKVMKDIAKTFFGCEPELAAIETQFEKLDKDGNNRIDMKEFKPFIKEYLKMMIQL